MLGALSAGFRYIATDVEPETVSGNQELAVLLGLEDKISLHLSPAEEFDPGEDVGLVFTSPPYFDRERYSKRESQSWVEHGGSVEKWVEGFLSPVFQTAYRRLVTGAALVINIADLKEKGSIVPLVSLTEETAVKVGFSYQGSIKMPLAKLNRKTDFEPVLIFRKGVR